MSRTFVAPTAWVSNIIIHFLGIVLGGLLYPLKFGTNDDSAMALIWAGAVNGVPLDQPRLIYISSFIGRILQEAKRWAPGFDSYTFLQQSLVLLASLTICWVILNRYQTWAGKGLAALFVFTYTSYFTYSIQFTQTSMILALAGFTALLHGMLWSRRWGLWLLVGPGLIALGCLYRHATTNMVMILAPVIVLLAVFLIHYRSSPWQAFMPRIILTVCALFAVIFTITQAKQLDDRLYYSDPNWLEYKQAEAYRSNVQINLPIGYSYKELAEYAAANTQLSFSEVSLLMTWQIFSTDLNKSDNLKAVSAAFDQLPELQSAQDWTAFLSNLFSWSRAYPELWYSVFTIFAAGGLISIATITSGSGQQIRPVLYSAAVWAGFYIFLIVAISLFFRLPPPRVFVPLASVFFILSAVTGIALSSDPTDSKASSYFPSSKKFNLAVLFIVSIALLASPVASVTKRSIRVNAWKAGTCNPSYGLVDLLKSYQDERILMMPIGVTSTCYVSPYSHKYPSILTEKAVIFGWMGYTPWLQRRLFAHHNSLPDILCKETKAALYTGSYGRDHLSLYFENHVSSDTKRKMQFEELVFDQSPIYRLTCNSKK